MNLKERFDKLTPKTKKLIVIGAAAFVVLVIFILMVKASNVGKETKRPEQQQAVISTSFDGATDKNTSIKLGVDKKVDGILDRIEKLEKSNSGQDYSAEDAHANDTVQNNNADSGSERPPLFRDLKDVDEPNTIKQAYPPAQQTNFNAQPQQPTQPTEKVISEIGFISVMVPDAVKKAEEKKKKQNWIPSNSIFKATLVTGVYAPTLAAGKQSPYPVVLRLKDLSFFPNEIRKDLSGCFAGGEAYGNLSDERVSIRLNNLSCISELNQTVVDVPVEGYVQGEDGSIGLAGRVVSKQGQVMAAAFVASFLQGMGEAFSLANQTTSVSSLTGSTTTNISGEDIIKYGAGSGFSESFKMLAKYYTDILNETAPVIEVMGGRSVEVIIKKGVDINPEGYEWTDLK